jgi:hypothetical protein
MKISVDGKDLFDLSPIQCKVICNDIHEDIFDEDMKRRLQYILMHKYEECFKRLKAEWCDGSKSKLAQNGVESIPTDPDKLAELIFSQPNYKGRKQRELESAEVAKEG